MPSDLAGRGNSGVFVLVAAELAQIGEMLVHAEESIVARNSSLFTVTYSSVHPARNSIRNMSIEGVHVRVRVLVADVIIHGN